MRRMQIPEEAEKLWSRANHPELHESYHEALT